MSGNWIQCITDIATEDIYETSEYYENLSWWQVLAGVEKRVSNNY